jgi:hypothetical protein
VKIAELLTELRKNPDQNPKVSVNDELADAIDQLRTSYEGRPTNLFVSFTAVDKLGINPQSKYDTPLGIYAYPATYVEDKVGARPMTNLPFAGDSPYATIFKSRGNIVNLADMPESDVIDYYQKIAKYWSQISRKDWKTSVDEVENIIKDASDKATFKSRPGGQFWYVTMQVAKLMAEINKPKERQIAPKKYPRHVSWNTLFRAIGINGCVDTGVGIIHTSEPHQAVFFDISAVDVVKRVHNRANYSPAVIAQKVAQGQFDKTWMADQFERFRRMSVADQTREVLNTPLAIRFMPNPPEDLQRQVVRLDPEAIGNIRNPSEQLQLEVVSRSATYLKYVFKTVRRPSEAVQIAAINNRFNNMYAFDLIMAQGIRPTPAVQMAAVGQDFTKTLELLKKYNINPSEQVKQAVERELERRKYW